MLIRRTHFLSCCHLNHLEGSQGSTLSLTSGPCSDCACSFSRFFKSSILPFPPHSTCLYPICKKNSLQLQAFLAPLPCLAPPISVGGAIQSFFCINPPSPHMAILTALLLNIIPYHTVSSTSWTLCLIYC